MDNSSFVSQNLLTFSSLLGIAIFGVKTFLVGSSSGSLSDKKNKFFSAKREELLYSNSEN